MDREKDRLIKAWETIPIMVTMGHNHNSVQPQQVSRLSYIYSFCCWLSLASAKPFLWLLSTLNGRPTPITVTRMWQIKQEKPSRYVTSLRPPCLQSNDGTLSRSPSALHRSWPGGLWVCVVSASVSGPPSPDQLWSAKTQEGALTATDSASYKQRRQIKAHCEC